MPGRTKHQCKGPEVGKEIEQGGQCEWSREGKGEDGQKGLERWRGLPYWPDESLASVPADGAAAPPWMSLKRNQYTGPPPKSGSRTPVSAENAIGHPQGQKTLP